MQALLSALVVAAFGGFAAWLAYGRGVAHERDRCFRLAWEEQGRAAHGIACQMAEKIAIRISSQTGSADGSKP